MFEIMDGLITYEGDVCGNDKTDYNKYLKISDLIYEQIKKIGVIPNESKLMNLIVPALDKAKLELIT